MFKKKTKYENIYEWVKSNEGTCFYCKEDKPIDIKFIGNKGICNDCAEHFEIGHVGADHTAIDKLSPVFENAKQAKAWLIKMGVELVYKYSDDGIDFYDAINDEVVYLKHKERMSKATGPVFANDDVMNELFSYNNVEISTDGYIHIIY